MTTQPWIGRQLIALRKVGVEVVVLSFRPPGPATEELKNLQWSDLDVKFVEGRPAKIRKAVIRGGPRAWARFARAVIASFGMAPIGPKRTVSAFEAAYLIGELEGFHGFDLIHVHFHARVLHVLLFSRMTSTPFVTTFQSFPVRPKNRLDPRLENVIWQRARTVFVNSGFGGRQIAEHGCPADRIVVMPQVIDPGQFPFRPLPPPGKDEPLRILTVARLSPEKGHRYALLAARRLADNGLPFHWTFVGRGPEKEDLQHLVEKLGVGSLTEFIDLVPSPDLIHLYHRSHVVVLPSVSRGPGTALETQGVVMQEAQALGCLVVASRVGGIPECVHDGVDAFLVRERSSRELAHRIRQLAARPETWPAIRAAARKNVEDNFSTEALTGRIVQNYERACAGPRHGPVL